MFKPVTVFFLAGTLRIFSNGRFWVNLKKKSFSLTWKKIWGKEGVCWRKKCDVLE